MTNLYYIAFTERGSYESKIGQTITEFAASIADSLVENNESAPTIKSLFFTDGDDYEVEINPMSLGMFEAKIEDYLDGASADYAEQKAYNNELRSSKVGGTL
jgi:hypothetical protein